ncbi:MAG: M24 family metallopeptidase [Athalassotoga sp.]|uniref:M24 family metallopeptidase n=2 Tax=Athalassotoga sp. TaxID=2022597 RepID=UPI003CFDF707
MMERSNDVSRKINLLRQYMLDKKKNAVLIRRTDNFAWITSGARSYVSITNFFGAAFVIVTSDRSYVLTKNMESKRLKNEELTDNFEIVEIPWFEDIEKSTINFLSGKDFVDDSENEFSNFLSHSRVELSEYEISNYKNLGFKSTEALERSMKKIDRNMTEIEVKALVEYELTKAGLDVLLVLVYGDKSRLLYRHNLPRNLKIGNKCIVSICAKEKGLVASVTRTVEFEKDVEFEKQHRINAVIDTQILEELSKTYSLSEMFSKIKEIYRKNGYPEEWKLHHQGGITGYNSREFISTPYSNVNIKNNMAFAWNPTITGTKFEDTYLKTENGIVPLTFIANSNWPVLNLEINGNQHQKADVLFLS